MSSQETNIAKLRNLLSPIVSYFSIKKTLEKEELNPTQEEELKKLLVREEKLIQAETMKKILELVKNDDNWN